MIRILNFTTFFESDALALYLCMLFSEAKVSVPVLFFISCTISCVYNFNTKINNGWEICQIVIFFHSLFGSDALASLLYKSFSKAKALVPKYLK